MGRRRVAADGNWQFGPGVFGLDQLWMLRPIRGGELLGGRVLESREGEGGKLRGMDAIKTSEQRLLSDTW